jgi:hypothetical protein
MYLYHIIRNILIFIFQLFLSLHALSFVHLNSIWKRGMRPHQTATGVYGTKGLETHKRLWRHYIYLQGTFFKWEETARIAQMAHWGQKAWQD